MRSSQSEVIGRIGRITEILSRYINTDRNKEWILTNGIGGYASLTLTHENRRKFHGLLIASLSKPLRRWVFLSNLKERIFLDGWREIEWKEYKAYPLPSFRCGIGNIEIEKTYVMPRNENSVIVRYKGNADFKMKIIPWMNSRHIYDLNPGDIKFDVDVRNGEIGIKAENVEKVLRIIGDFKEVKNLSEWIESRYDIDRERKEGWIDHAFIPLEAEIESRDRISYLIFTLEDRKYYPEIEFGREVERRNDIIIKSNLPDELFPLILSADSFVVERNHHKSVIAGYHWFGDWGRDSLISLLGLFLVTNRYEDAKSLLFGLSRYEKHGLIPNLFSERENVPMYNSVDTSLWFIDRVYQYMKYTNDVKFLKEVWATLERIIDRYIHGTDYKIRMDEDFLLSHGEGLTWMDVKIGDRYITPRSGKAVEIQSLWYNAVKIMKRLSRLLGKDYSGYRDLSEKIRESFQEKFDKLYDVIDKRDSTLRPNIIFLVSLDFDMIEKRVAEQIIDAVERYLLTPFGVRTLSPGDPRYKGSLIGDYDKDLAYHNGCAWPWLLGFFIKGYLKVKGYSEENRLYLFDRYLYPLLKNLLEGCIGSVNEIFDGDFPFKPRGCISQAWSVAEILRAIVEDILFVRPCFERYYESL